MHSLQGQKEHIMHYLQSKANIKYETNHFQDSLYYDQIYLHINWNEEYKILRNSPRMCFQPCFKLTCHWCIFSTKNLSCACVKHTHVHLISSVGGFIQSLQISTPFIMEHTSWGNNYIWPTINTYPNDHQECYRIYYNMSMQLVVLLYTV